VKPRLKPCMQELTLLIKYVNQPPGGAPSQKDYQLLANAKASIPETRVLLVPTQRLLAQEPFTYSLIFFAKAAGRILGINGASPKPHLSGRISAQAFNVTMMHASWKESVHRDSCKAQTSQCVNHACPSPPIPISVDYHHTHRPAASMPTL
jgi:hypothetical protein